MDVAIYLRLGTIVLLGLGIPYHAVVFFVLVMICCLNSLQVTVLVNLFKNLRHQKIID